jgi:hypothetical protein
MLEITEGTIKNRQFGDTGNIVHTTKDEQQKKTQKTTEKAKQQKTKKMGHMDRP